MTDDPSELSRRALLGSLATAGTIGVAGCSALSDPGSDAVDPVWRRDLEASWGASPPAVSDTVVLAGGQDKALHALDPEDGSTSFTVDTGGPIEQRPAVPAAGGPYHVHSTDGDLYTVDEEGSQLWAEEGQDATGVIGRAGSLLVVDDPDTESVRGLDPVTGEERFRYASRTYHYPGLTPDAFALPVSSDDDEVELVVVNHDGSVRWRRDFLDWYPTPVVTGDRLYLRSAATVTAHALGDGSVHWEKEVGGDTQRLRNVTVGDDVYVQREPDGDHVELLALDRGTGQVRWTRTGGYMAGRVVPTDDAVYLASPVDDPDGGIVAHVDRFGLDGTKEWERTTELAVGGYIDGAFRVGDLLCIQNDRSLLALDPTSGEHRWRFETDSSRIGVTTGDTALYVSLLDEGEVTRLPTN